MPIQAQDTSNEYVDQGKRNERSMLQEQLKFHSSLITCFNATILNVCSSRDTQRVHLRSV